MIGIWASLKRRSQSSQEFFFSVPKVYIGPIGNVVLRLVEIAPVVKTTGPVKCRAIEVLLVIGREGSPLLIRLMRSFIGRVNCVAMNCDGSVVIFALGYAIAILESFPLHLLELVEPRLLDMNQKIKSYLEAEKYLA
jgi:hypothetical protein